MMMLIIFLLGIVDISDVQMCWCSWYLMVSAPRVLRQASSSDFERIRAFLQLRWLKSRQEKEDDDGDDDCDANDYCIKDDNGVGNNDANGDDNDIYNAGDENPNSVECGEKNNVYLSASGDWGPGLADCSLRKNNWRNLYSKWWKESCFHLEGWILK